MGALQQLLNGDAALFDEMTAHQVYSFIQSVKGFPFPLCAGDGRHDDRLSLLPPPSPIVVSSSAMRTWTTSAVSSYLQDRFPVPGNAYAPLCPRSRRSRPSLPTEYGPTLPRGIKTMPPISYSMTRTCTSRIQLPRTLTFIHSLIHTNASFQFNHRPIPKNTKNRKKITDSNSTRDTRRFSLTCLSKRCPCGTGRTTR